MGWGRRASVGGGVGSVGGTHLAWRGRCQRRWRSHPPSPDAAVGGKRQRHGGHRFGTRRGGRSVGRPGHPAGGPPRKAAASHPAVLRQHPAGGGRGWRRLPAPSAARGGRHGAAGCGGVPADDAASTKSRAPHVKTTGGASCHRWRGKVKREERWWQASAWWVDDTPSATQPPCAEVVRGGGAGTGAKRVRLVGCDV